MQSLFIIRLLVISKRGGANYEAREKGSINQLYQAWPQTYCKRFSLLRSIFVKDLYCLHGRVGAYKVYVTIKLRILNGADNRLDE